MFNFKTVNFNWSWSGSSFWSDTLPISGWKVQIQNYKSKNWTWSGSSLWSDTLPISSSKVEIQSYTSKTWTRSGSSLWSDTLPISGCIHSFLTPPDPLQSFSHARLAPSPLIPLHTPQISFIYIFYFYFIYLALSTLRLWSVYDPYMFQTRPCSAYDLSVRSV